MSWAMPAPDDRVEWEFWSNPVETVSKTFQRTFKDQVTSLGTHAFFTPHYYIYNGIDNGCHGSGSNNPCGNLCINNGRYCSVDPDNDIDKGVSGADVVKESLRQLCIWKHFGVDGIGEVWWDYKKCFIESCDDGGEWEKIILISHFFSLTHPHSPPVKFNDETCVAECYTSAGIDAATINQCISDSGGFTADQANSYLDAEIAAKDALGIVVIPASYINDVELRGALTASTVFSGICAGFLDGTEPDICKKCSGCPELNDCVTTGFCGNNPNGGDGSGGGGVGVGWISVTTLVVR